MAMAIDDNIDNHTAKKMKLQDAQDGTFTLNFKDPQPIEEYYVLMELKAVNEMRSSREHPLCFFSRMMKDVGCAESQINEYGYSSYCFLANLTPEKAKKLSDLDSIREVKLYQRVPLDCYRQIYIRER